ncbi:MAG: TatD family hydrolase [Gammaproteobacteria bacterium]|nr:TatD family hydrolase [Gammaproteobacteria bacterium]
MLIDTHCHLDLPIFSSDRQKIIKRCQQLGIKKIIVPGIDAKGWANLLNICHSEPSLFPALGLHPAFLKQHHPSDIQKLEQLIDQVKPVAIGEIGLDYYLKELDQTQQKILFEAQLNIAKNTNLPVLLHVRKAHDTVLAILRRIRVVGGIAHAFNGSLQQAKQYIDLGFMLGFGGALTYQRTTRLRTLARLLPLDAIVLETDAPDMVVSNHHGERNSPEYLIDCFGTLAEIRREERSDIEARTTKNANTIFKFGIKKEKSP